MSSLFRTAWFLLVVRLGGDGVCAGEYCASHNVCECEEVGLGGGEVSGDPDFFGGGVQGCDGKNVSVRAVARGGSCSSEAGVSVVVVEVEGTSGEFFAAFGASVGVQASGVSGNTYCNPVPEP